MLALTFSVGEGRYALDVGSVVQVVPRIALQPVPHAPVGMAGVFDHEGTVVPVVDLGLLLRSEPCAERLSTRIVLAEAPGGGRLGLIAERVTELRVVPDDPNAAEAPGGAFLGPMVSLADGLIQILRVGPVAAAMLSRSAGEVWGGP